jgi:uncharacterized protein YndB with AHSA1/START domain
MIRFESSTQFPQPVAKLFAFVEDFRKAPSWLEGCVELKKVSPEVTGVGSRLYYVHDHGGRRGEMEGVVTAYEKDRKLEMTFQDATFQVDIAFRFAPEAGGTCMTHGVVIQPKRMVAKLMAPMIRAGNRRQVASNLERLKREVERDQG